MLSNILIILDNIIELVFEYFSHRFLSNAPRKITSSIIGAAVQQGPTLECTGAI